MRTCLNCNKVLARKPNIYCSSFCQHEFQYRVYINEWKQGKVDGGKGVMTRNIAGPLTRYLREKYKQCSICGWDQVNQVTGRVPLEIDHIDGNSENNQEKNLRLICPNCHSLSSTFRNLNKGNGREWRRLKYVKSA